MTLLEALIKVTKHDLAIPNARMAHFAFADDTASAFLSEIEAAELVPLVEEWCRQQRAEMGSVH